MIRLFLATRNAHKVQEIRAVLGDQHRYLSLADVPGAPVAVEDAETFAGNATKKAVQLAVWLAAQSPAEPGAYREQDPTTDAHYVLADDSGLEVDALNGAPGVLSARFAALDTGQSGNSADAANNAKLLSLLREVPAEKRTAHFRCVIALVPVPRLRPPTAPLVLESELRFLTELYQGVCPGHVESEARGATGFGYDPLFVPLGHRRTFAELGEAEKNQISHRARALEKLRKRLSRPQ